MSARRVEVIGLASMVALAGSEHGLGEALQGNVAPPGIAFRSWEGVPWFAILGGEPAMSLVPNLLVSGVLTIAASVAFGVVAASIAGERGAGRVLALLSAVLLLVGGGFGPPILGLLVALAAARASRPLVRRRAGWPASAWPWVFGLTFVAWLLVFPGVPALAAAGIVDGPMAVLASTLVAFLLVPVGIVTGAAFDARLDSRAPVRAIAEGALP